MYHLILVLVSTTAMLAAAPRIRAGQCGDGPCGVVCPQCHACCTLDVQCGQEEKSCFEVECKQICIPRVVFPWQQRPARCGACADCTGGCDSCAGGCGSCCTANKGARVKTVRTLKKVKYECPKCKYEWTPACGGSSCGTAAGCDASCGAGAAPAAPTIAPQPALSPAPQALRNPMSIGGGVGITSEWH